MTKDNEISDQLDALAAARHNNPFAVLGLQTDSDGKRVVRTIQPQASSVELINARGESIGDMERIHPAGIFQGVLPPRLRHYVFRITMEDGHQYTAEDSYRFPSSLGEIDLYLLGEGSHRAIYSVLGAQCRAIDGVTGTRFAVWAPNASRVSVVGSFNDWDGRRHPMRLHPANGLWEIFIPAVGPGDCYKYEILDRDGNLLPLKVDPLAQFCESPPGNASIVYDSDYEWNDRAWMNKRSPEPALDDPIIPPSTSTGPRRISSGSST